MTQTPYVRSVRTIEDDVGADVLALPGPADILASGTVKGNIAGGSSFASGDAGEHDLGGVSDRTGGDSTGW